VLYAGRIAEVGPAGEVLGAPAHPYTRGLLRSRLTLDTVPGSRLAAMPGSVPSPLSPLPGCAFSPRCDQATDDCEKSSPEPTSVGAGRVSACLLTPGQLVHDPAAELDAGPEPVAAQPVGPAAADQPAAVTVTDVTKTFTVAPRGRLQALRGVTLRVGHGESVALVGESGSGKSTLLRVIAGLEKATTGTVELAGDERPQMVFQDAGASLTPWLSVGELIAERLRGRKLSRTARRDAVIEVLDRVGLPAEVAKSRAGQLSGGQRQRVSLARATVVPPAVLLCDEPTSALDVSLAASVLNLIADLRRGLDMMLLFLLIVKRRG